MKIKTIDVNALEWFDKINGNSYFSAEIVLNYGLNAVIVLECPFQYGYGDQFTYEAQKKLLELGYLPQEGKNRGLFTIAEALGFDYYNAKAETKKANMFKLYANYQEEKVTISNKEKN